METFDIHITVADQQYKGWVTPSKKLNDDGIPVSWHVVLNEVNFGNVSCNAAAWTVDEPRPQAVTDAIGEFISGYIK